MSNIEKEIQLLTDENARLILVQEQLSLQNKFYKDQLNRAKHYTGYEARACPLCTYKNGTFIESCQMHKQIDKLHERLKQYEPKEYYINKS